MKINNSRILILISAALMAALTVMDRGQTAPGVLIPTLSFTVSRSDDRNNATCVPGDCSLREAVNASNASATDDTIDFASGLTTITLTNEIVIGNGNTGALAINGPGANVLTIDGGPGTNRIFTTRYATVLISGVTLTGGDGTGADTNPWGGAIEVVGGAVTLDGVHVEGNTVSDYGGGVFFNTGTHRVINSTISGNTARNGGGITAVNGSLAIVNSTISGNISNGGGGGLLAVSYDGLDVSLRNVTLTNNTATVGGGIYSAILVGLDIGNTVVAGNRAAGGNNEIYCQGCSGFTSAGGNLVGDSPGDSNIPGLVFQPTDIRDTNPRLGPLQNNGGTTPTHALMAGSPVIDRGLNALAVDPFNGNALAFDQRGAGFTRIRDGNGDGTATVDIGAFELQPVNVANLEELYSAVNNPQNAGRLIIAAPGVYMLSVNDPSGAARPNSGRLELQENMSLQGVVGDRGAVIIDALNLPASSYNGTVANTGAVRMGKGTNSIEWLKVRDAINGGAGIIAHLSAPGMAVIHIAHIATSGNERGIDVRNIGASAAGYVIRAEIVDNDVDNNTLRAGLGLRIINSQGANGSVISATLSGNRFYNNQSGFVVQNTGSTNFGVISVSSSGDRFYENGIGAVVFGGLGTSNGNTVTFKAFGDSFENNNGFSFFDVGGLLVIGGENTSIPNGTSNNTVNVVLRACRLANNQLHDLAAIGARSNPVSIGFPGTNNHVTVRLYSTYVQILETADSIPDYPGGMNSATVSRPSFDFDDDGKTDIGIFRPAVGEWWINRSLNGTTLALQFGASTDKIAPADYTGDGKTDIAFWRPSTGQWFILRSEDGSYFAFPFGTNGDIPMPADYDGDGKADAAVFRPSTGTWFILRSSDGQVTFTQFGANGDLPVASDYDGDGKADVAIYRPNGTNGAEWWIQRSTAGLLALQFGSSTDNAVPGDYTGDGKTDIAFFRPSTGFWYVLRSEDFSYFAFPWGQAGDVPAPGDYDGDGTFDAAVFRPSNSTWYVSRSTAGPLFVGFGVATDQPVPNAYVR